MTLDKRLASTRPQRDLNAIIDKIEDIDTEIADIDAVIEPLRTPTVQGCYVRSTVRPSIPDAAWTSIEWNDEAWEQGGCWAATNPNRLVAPAAGYYTVSAHVLFICGAHNAGLRQLALRDQDGIYLKQEGSPSSGAVAFGFTSLSVEIAAHLMAAGDWIEAAVYQDSGTNLEIYEAPVLATGNLHGNGARFWRLDYLT